MIRLFSPLLGLVASNAHANHPAILEKDFRTMMAWFPGVYGNQEQVYFEAEQSRALMKLCAMSGFTTCLRR